jgi:hypothetical protein
VPESARFVPIAADSSLPAPDSSHLMVARLAETLKPRMTWV